MSSDSFEAIEYESFVLETDRNVLQKKKPGDEHHWF